MTSFTKWPRTGLRLPRVSPDRTRRLGSSRPNLGSVRPDPLTSFSALHPVYTLYTVYAVYAMYAVYTSSGSHRLSKTLKALAKL